jgi:hypothetical protein
VSVLLRAVWWCAGAGGASRGACEHTGRRQFHAVRRTLRLAAGGPAACVVAGPTRVRGAASQPAQPHLAGTLTLTLTQARCASLLVAGPTRVRGAASQPAQPHLAGTLTQTLNPGTLRLAAGGWTNTRAWCRCSTCSTSPRRYSNPNPNPGTLRLAAGGWTNTRAWCRFSTCSTSPAETGRAETGNKWTGK